MAESRPRPALVTLRDLDDFWVAPVREPEWRRQAACQVEEHDEFFPNGRPPERLKAVCASCPVRAECREFALDSPWRPYGIWGGMSSTELMPEWTQRHAEAT